MVWTESQPIVTDKPTVMLKHLLSLLTVLFTAGQACQSPSAGDTNKADANHDQPSIIFILADDLGYADLEPYSQQYIQTPHLLRLAKEGMLFTQHYAGNTVCAPSRCALMTGQHMGHAQIRGNAQAGVGGEPPITEDIATVAKVLKSAGYATAMVGKWGLGAENTSGDPLKQGFDTYYGYLDQVLAHNYFPEYLLRDGKKEMLDNEVTYGDTSQWHRGRGSYSQRQVDYSHDLFTQQALAYIQQDRQQPFFLYLPFTIPHNNGEAPEGYQQEVPDLAPYEQEDWPREAKAYAAMITRLDRTVGQIMAQLKAKGIDEKTMVLFSSDNGPMSNKDFTQQFDSNGALRGGKRDLYEGGIRVPMIARWPGQIAPGSQTDHVSAFWDFLPTVCQMTGTAVPDEADGLSYLPTLLNAPGQQQHDYLYWEFPERGYSVALRQGKWKAVRGNMQENPTGPIELYNLENDLSEQHDVADQHPQKVKELTQLMSQAHEPSALFPMPGDAPAE